MPRTNHPHRKTAAELAELLRPFVGARLSRDPRTAAVDILAITNRIDADIRAVSGEGLTMFFYDGCQLVPWSDIRRVTVRQIGDGVTAAQTVYEPHQLARAA